MTEFLQQLPALIGVLLGGGATYLSTSAAERARWRRAQAIRWDEKRLTVYTEYAYAVKKVIGIAVRIAADQGMHPDIDKLPLAEGVVALAAAEHERTTKWESVLMLASEDAIIAARAWHESAFRLQLIAVGRTNGASWTEAVEAASQARRKFYEVVRKDIGLAIRGSSQSYEWRPSAGPRGAHRIVGLEQANETRVRMPNGATKIRSVGPRARGAAIAG